MKHIIAAIALLAITAPALAQLDPRTQDYRKWSAEQMIQRLNKLGANGHPVLQSIRQVAADGDDVIWAAVVDEVHKLEDKLRK